MRKLLLGPLPPRPGEAAVAAPSLKTSDEAVSYTHLDVYKRQEQVDGLLLAVGAGAVAFRGVEEHGVIRLPQRCAQQDESVLAAGQINTQIEGQRAAHGSLGEARGQSAVLRLERCV